MLLPITIPSHISKNNCYLDFWQYRIVLPVFVLYIGRFIRHMFYVLFLLLSIMFVRSTLYVAVVHSVSLLNDIWLYEYATIYLSILILMDIYFVSSVWLLQKMLWFLYVSPGTHVYTFLLNIIIGLEFLGHRQSVYSTIIDNAKMVLRIGCTCI